MTIKELKNKIKDLDLKSNIFYKMIDDMGQMQIPAYKDYICDKNFLIFFEDDELVSTALSFFKYNLNISKTAKNTYMHRNTLDYRLKKIQKITGLDIRDFHNAVALNALIFLKLKMINS